MGDSNERLEAERRLILDAKDSGPLATLLAYIRLSGPGWLQSAITLGGGSLAGSLYLGVIGGYQMLWLQPLMMLLGVCMLSAIGYVALSSKERPFQAINRHINPVLGWGWAIATLMANLVWAMPQFSLGVAALQQNLFPQWLSGNVGGVIATAFLFVVATFVICIYDRGGWGLKVFEFILKAMVAVVVLSFFGVVVAMAGQIPWNEVGAGFIPNLRMLFEPADRLKPMLAQSEFVDYWQNEILNTQRDRMVTAAATAVGINMTFLLPYSMLKRGWDRDFRGLATFDLFTGLLIPFMLATSCVVIASASQFHGRWDPAWWARRFPVRTKLRPSNRPRSSAMLTREISTSSCGTRNRNPPRNGATPNSRPPASRSPSPTRSLRTCWSPETPTRSPCRWSV